MNAKKRMILVRALGWLILAVGLYALRPTFQPGVYAWIHLRGWFNLPGLWDGIHFVYRHQGAYFALTTALLYLVFYAKFVVAYGLIRLRPWTRYLAPAVLGADFVVRLTGQVNLWIQSSHIRERIPDWAGNGEGTSITFSMWPASITALVSLLVFVILCRQSIQALFTNASEGNQGGCG